MAKEIARKTDDAELSKRPVGPTPTEMIMSLINSERVDAEQAPALLQRLVDMEYAHAARQAKAAFDAAMLACQREMPTVVSDRENSHTRSKYATLEHVMVKAKPVWIRHGFSISFDEEPGSRDDMVRLRMRVSGHGHTETFTREAEVDNKGAKGNDVKTALQGRQSTFSYLRRQLLCSVFNITVAGEDIDGNDPVPDIDEKQLSQLVDMLELAQVSQSDFCSRYRIASVEGLPENKFKGAMAALRATCEKKGIRL